MSETADFLAHAIMIGVGATAVMDLWAALRKRLFNTPSLNYALVGRWIGHMPRGRFVHAPIAAAPPIPGEAAMGWAAHYAIGVAFAAVLLAVWGLDWARDPSLMPALIVGVGTVAAPFLILQPAFGLGIAASRTPNPTVARVRSLTTHLSFGLGLYLTAELLSRL